MLTDDDVLAYDERWGDEEDFVGGRILTASKITGLIGRWR